MTLLAIYKDITDHATHYHDTQYTNIKGSRLLGIMGTQRPPNMMFVAILRPYLVTGFHKIQ